MDVINAIILGAVQGLTEFLPVSSSGHLVLVSHLLHQDLEGEAGTAMSVLLHLGSLLAILIVFRADIVRLFLPRLDLRKLGLLFWASLPAAIVGIGIKKGLPEASSAWVEGHVLQSPWVAACGLLVTATVLWLAERPRELRVTLQDAKGRDFWLVGVIGLAQAIAILPGVSRSGSTICVALMLHWVRNDAVRLSFLMGMIAIGGAGLLEARHITQFEAAPAISGFASSLVFSLIGLTTLKLVVGRQKLRWFAAYCAVVGVVALVWLFAIA
ncbi:MAG: undecaprenyl-diphosphate phosphatase [Planctomycetes bacterium]|nr:undecaprenyl-diphosphate phosphatase [Planctomycetota bacterium]